MQAARMIPFQAHHAYATAQRRPRASFDMQPQWVQLPDSRWQDVAGVDRSGGRTPKPSRSGGGASSSNNSTTDDGSVAPSLLEGSDSDLGYSFEFGDCETDHDDGDANGDDDAQPVCGR